MAVPPPPPREITPSIRRSAQSLSRSLGAAAAVPQAPEPEGEDVAALRDAAEDIVNAAAPDILAEFANQKPKKRFTRKYRGGSGKGKRKK